MLKNNVPSYFNPTSKGISSTRMFIPNPILCLIVSQGRIRRVWPSRGSYCLCILAKTNRYKMFVKTPNKPNMPSESITTERQHVGVYAVSKLFSILLLNKSVEVAIGFLTLSMMSLKFWLF